MTSQRTPRPSGSPTPQRHRHRAQVTRFQAWAAEHHGAPADGGYPALHRWSVDELDTFWRAVAEWFDVRFSTPYETVLGDPRHARRHLVPRRHPQLRRARPARRRERRADAPGAPVRRRDAEQKAVSWAELRRQVGSLAAELRALGVRPGDRVSGYLPNIPAGRRRPPRHRGRRRGLDLLRPRLRRPQRPRPLPAGRTRRPVHRRRLPLRRQGTRPHGHRRRTPRRTPHPARRRPHPAAGHTSPRRRPRPGATLTCRRRWNPVFEQVPFDHPLWVLYSSGTTGLPKAIVQSQGGILLEHLKQLGAALRPRTR